MSNSAITGNQLGMQVCEALGIDCEKTLVRRIVIDIAVNDLVKVYVETIGTEKLLDIKLPESGIEIIKDGEAYKPCSEEHCNSQ